jgi:hypothetical protein
MPMMDDRDASKLQQFGQLMIHKTRIAVIGETVGQRAGQPQALIHLPEQQHAAVGGERAAGKIGHDLAVAEVLKEQRLVITVCRGSSGGVHGFIGLNKIKPLDALTAASVHPSMIFSG